MTDNRLPQTPEPSREIVANPLLVSALGGLHVLVGALGLLVALVLCSEWFRQAPPDSLARLVQCDVVARRWLYVGVPLAVSICLALLVAGFGLLTRKSWALRTTFYCAAAAIGLSLLGLIVIPAYFGERLFAKHGPARAIFNLTLSHPGTSPVTVAYTTADATALADADYVATNGTLKIPAGVTRKSIAVIVKSDQVAESPTETFTLNLTNAVNARLRRAQGVATIVDDDGPPTLSIADTSVSEGNSGIQEALFDVTLANQSLFTNTTVEFATADGTALAGKDYLPERGTLTFWAGQSKRTIKVEVRANTVPQPSRDFTVILSNAVHATLATTQAVGVIVDDDGPPTLAIADASAPEGNGARGELAFEVAVSRPSTKDVTVAFATADGTAAAGADFVATNGTLTIPVGEMTAAVKIPILSNHVPQDDRAFTVTISNAVNATLDQTQAVGTIIDDDGPPALSLSDARVTEGDVPPKPDVALLARLMSGGLRVSLFLGLLYPIVILVFASRASFLKAMGVDLSQSYHCGSLRYTTVGLFVLFAWLLWGDFVFQLMESVVPAVLPLNLKPLGASNTLMSIIMTTLPSILNVTVCPWISFKSDRYRGRWGRRIPFIVWTMPFLVASLIMLGWSAEIAGWLRVWLPAAQAMPSATLIVLIIAVLMVVFQFFNMFVSSVFWYLFNDVVPPQFLARFFGLFRLVSVAAGAVFQGVVFKYSETHMREIFTGGALLYLIGFGIVCLFVREGDYPPPPEGQYKRKGFLSDLKTYGNETFTCRFYWYLYAFGAFGRITGALGLFGVFFQKQMNLSLDQIGLMAMVGSIAGVIATYFTAVLVDRWHPLRIITYEKVFSAFMGFGMWVYIFVTLPGSVYFWLGIAGTLVSTFNAVLFDTAGYPLLMRVLPKSRYGQFSSANAMVRSAATIVAGVVAGLYMDFLKWLCHGSDFSYRLAFTWGWVCQIAGTVAVVFAYREWKRLGGDENYRSPAPWDPSGFEETIDKVKSAPGRPRLVMRALYLTVAGSVVGLLVAPVFWYYMNLHGQLRALWWATRVFWPYSLLCLFVSLWQIRSVRRDIADIENGRKPRFGVPHYGVFMVTAITGLISMPVGWLQTGWLIHLDMQREIILFGVNGIPVALAALGILQTIRLIEREPSPTARV